MKKTIIVVLIVVLVAGLAVYFYGKVIGPTEEGTPGMEEVEGVVEVDYPVGDKTPEHVAEVLGSWEAYEKLRDSKLRKPTKDSMQIVYATYVDYRVAWVGLVMRGEIIRIEGRWITIENEGDKISLYVWERADIYTENGKFEDLKEGDWLAHIAVVVNAERAEARVIRLTEGL